MCIVELKMGRIEGISLIHTPDINEKFTTKDTQDMFLHENGVHHTFASSIAGLGQNLSEISLVIPTLELHSSVRYLKLLAGKYD